MSVFSSFLVWFLLFHCIFNLVISRSRNRTIQPIKTSKDQKFWSCTINWLRFFGFVCLNFLMSKYFLKKSVDFILDKSVSMFFLALYLYGFLHDFSLRFSWKKRLIEIHVNYCFLETQSLYLILHGSRTKELLIFNTRWRCDHNILFHLKIKLFRARVQNTFDF